MRNKENYGNVACELRGGTKRIALRIRMNPHSRAPQLTNAVYAYIAPRGSYSANPKVPDCVYTIRLRRTYVPRHTGVHLK